MVVGEKLCKMGLDIYLYRAKNLSETLSRQEDYEKFSNNLWELHEKYEDFSENEIKEIKAKNEAYEKKLLIADKMEYAEEKVTERDSDIDPEHLFKIGYFRSSYNESGINSVLRDLGLLDLYGIFEQVGEEYCFKPNWDNALANTIETISALKNAPPFGVHDLYSFGIGSYDISDGKDALEIFMKEKETHKNGGSYSNQKGEFYLTEPLKVHGFIEGRKYNNRCIFVITDANYDWHITALEIVKQTIEWVLCQKDKSQYYLHWSG